MFRSSVSSPGVRSAPIRRSRLTRGPAIRMPPGASSARRRRSRWTIQSPRRNTGPDRETRCRLGRLALAAREGHIQPMLVRALLLLVLSVSPALAQPSAGGRAPYEGDLQRLSEILGALHYLRDICGAREGQVWRNEMQALVDAEAPSGERRERLVASFNRGYRGFQQTYRTCTPAADYAIRRYLEEGSKIARDITARYAN